MASGRFSRQVTRHVGLVGLPDHWKEPYFSGLATSPKYDKIAELVNGLNKLRADFDEYVPPAGPPTAHKTTHQDGGSDEINVGGLSGDLADAQDPKTHKTSHQNGGGDELSVEGLNGLLADYQKPTIAPYALLSTFLNVPAYLRFRDMYDEYPTTYDEDRPPHWQYAIASSGAPDADDRFWLENSTWKAHTGMKIFFRSREDKFRSIFVFPHGLPRHIVVRLKNFYYDDIGGSDRFEIFIYANVWDYSAGTVVTKTVTGLRLEYNQYYHYPNGVSTSTGWGDPESNGWHDITFFCAPMSSTTATGNRCPYRIGAASETDVVGHRDDQFDDNNDIFLGYAYLTCSPTMSAAWDIDAALRGIEIWVRNMDDL